MKKINNTINLRLLILFTINFNENKVNIPIIKLQTN